MRYVRRFAYWLGFRPHIGSVLYSPSKDFILAGAAFAKAVNEASEAHIHDGNLDTCRVSRPTCHKHHFVLGIPKMTYLAYVCTICGLNWHVARHELWKP